ncbi:metallophosphoesterase [Leuconostocaceae bacterium ESL0723]|nr:metallophosphoesterase [Leuconostocaceae bacterium ESL0723]
MLTFIHAADLHLGHPFQGLDGQLPPVWADRVQRATQQAFTSLIDRAVAEPVDLVVLAGDLFYRQAVSPRVEAVVQSGFERLAAAGIPVYLSFGNHDFGNQVRPDWPSNVHVFGPEVSSMTLTTKAGVSVVLTGFSYQHRHQNQAEIDHFPNRTPGSSAYYLGLYHGDVGSRTGDYAGASLGDLLAKNYNYWALGHIHQRQVINQVPPVLYPGSLQGLSAKESGPKGFYLVQQDRDFTQAPELNFVPVSPVVWQTVALYQVGSLADLKEQVQQLKVRQPTLLTLTLPADLPAELRRFILAGVTVDQLRADCPDQVWPVKITIRSENDGQVAAGELKGPAWQTSLAEVVTPTAVAELLPNDLPVFLRDYFLSDEGLASLREWVNATQLGEGADHEN